MPPTTYSSCRPLLHGNIFSILAENLYAYKALYKDLRHICKSSAAHSLKNIAAYISFLEKMLSIRIFSHFLLNSYNRRVIIRAFASQSGHLRFISLVQSYQKTLKYGIHSFPAWRSAFMGGCGEQAGKLFVCGNPSSSSGWRYDMNGNSVHAINLI